MIAHDYKPMRTFIVEPQVLIAKALHSLLNENPLVRVVGDATKLTTEDLKRTTPELLMFGLDNVSEEILAIVTRARAACPGMRICMLTSFANSDIMQRTMAAGADAFIVKDSSPMELDVAFRIIASGASYVDPRVAGQLLSRRQSQTIPNDARYIRELTSRESSILRLLAGGLSNKEIGNKLELSEKTVKNYTSRIFSKLHVTARTQAAVFAIKAGMV